MSTGVVLQRIRPLLLLFVTLVSLVSLTSVAHAAGRVEWKDKELKEREGGSWRLEIAMYLPSAPDVAHVPMKFEFMPTAYYERSMVDGDKLLERVVPLDNRQSLIESVDVGFMDAGSGKIEKRTRFSFKVTRAHGYEAGEYKVTIKDSRNGQTVGAPTTLKFKGENEVIDRRAMVFSGEKKKKKEAKPEDESGGGEDGDAKQDAPSEEGSAEAAASSDDASSDDAAVASGTEDGPPPIKEKPGGCGCRIEEQAGNQPSAFGLAALAALACWARRRRGARPLS